MANSIYSKNLKLTLETVTIQDFIIKYNAKNYIRFEAIFNTNMNNVLANNTVVLNVINETTKTILQSFPLNGATFTTKTKTIDIGNDSTTYNKDLTYFNNHYTTFNFFSDLSYNSGYFNSKPSSDYINVSLTVNGDTQYQNYKRTIKDATIYGVFSKTNLDYYNNKIDATVSKPFGLTSATLALSNYFFDSINGRLKLRLDNTILLNMYYTNVDNNIQPTLRESDTDFSFNSGTHLNYAIATPYTDSYLFNIISLSTNIELVLGKSNDTSCDIQLKQNAITQTTFGIDASFDTTLNKTNSTNSIVNVEFPLLYDIKSTDIISDINLIITDTVVQTASVISTWDFNTKRINFNITYKPTNVSTITDYFISGNNFIIELKINGTVLTFALNNNYSIVYTNSI